jgi:von Willebrand factor type A domain
MNMVRSIHTSVVAAVFFTPVLLTCSNPGSVGSTPGGQGGAVIIGLNGGSGGGSGLGGGAGNTGPQINLDASAAGGAATGGQGGAAPPAADSNCGITSVSTTKQPADLLLVLDRSNSMARDITQDQDCPAGSTTCTSRWKAVTDAVKAVLPDTQDTVYWGLKLFATSQNGCDVTDGVDVAPGPGNASAISAQIAATGPSTGTPTTEVIRKTSSYLLGLTDTNPKYILLATDGQPYCAGPQKDQPDDQAAIDSIKNNAFAHGIKVFVVGLTISAANTATLNSMAVAGGTTQFYAADSPAALKDALQNISGIVATCSFTLAKAPPDPNNIAVFLDGTRAPNDATNGWVLTTNNTKVEITGSYCDSIKNGNAKDVQVLMGCAPIPIGVIP